MSRLVDPTICPDCRAPLDAAGHLHRLRPAVDRAAGRRACGRTCSRPTGSSSTCGQVAPAPSPAAHRRPPSDLRGRPSPALGASAGISVPVVLLSLGGLCLLVAAVVFVAVAWSSLGLGAKTAILLAVTALLGATAVARSPGAACGSRRRRSGWWSARMIALDLTAAHDADLLGLGALDARRTVATVGGAVLATAVASGAWTTTTVLRQLRGIVVAGALGGALLAAGGAWTADHNPAVTALAVPVLAALAVLTGRVAGGGVRPTAYALAAVTAVTWLVLLGFGVDRLATTDGVGLWWHQLPGWPLLAAAGYAALLTAVPTADWLRMAGSAGALVALGLFAVGPGSGPTADLLAVSAVVVVLAVATATAPRVWSVPAGVLTGIATAGFAALSVLRPLEVVGEVASRAPAHRANLDLTLPAAPPGPATWTAPLVTVVLGLAAASLLRLLRMPEQREAAGRAWVALGPGVVALGVVTALLETRPTLLVAVLAWTAALLLAAAMAATSHRHALALLASLALVGYLAVVGLRLAAPSHLLSAVLATAIAAGFALFSARAPREALEGVLLPLLTGGGVLTASLAALHWPYVLGGRGDAAALTTAAVASLLGVTARWSARTPPARLTAETIALLTGLLAGAAATDRATVAAALTLVGSGVALLAVLHRDRDLASWLAVPILGVAMQLRILEDLPFPELATVPAAVVLLGAGTWRMRTDDRARSPRVLGTGLLLGLAPSLLLALDDPVSLRGALLGGAALLVLGLGAASRWSAPFLAGAGAAAVLAVRHLWPVAEALPRWLTLGTVGVVLLLVGVTWEARLRNLRAAGRYLAALR